VDACASAQLTLALALRGPIHKKISGKTKVEVRDKLREIHKETEAGAPAAEAIHRG
jgi:hypothetical protein